MACPPGPTQSKAGRTSFHPHMLPLAALATASSSPFFLSSLTLSTPTVTSGHTSQPLARQPAGPLLRLVPTSPQLSPRPPRPLGALSPARSLPSGARGHLSTGLPTHVASGTYVVLSRDPKNLSSLGPLTLGSFPTLPGASSMLQPRSPFLGPFP